MITELNLISLQEGLDKNRAILILSPSNRFYFTGFESSAGFCFITNKSRYFVTDFRYIEAAKNSVKSFDVVLQEAGIIAEISKLCKVNDINEIIVESEFVTLNQFNSFKSELQSVEIISDGKLDTDINKFRMIKSEQEIFRISAAASISEEALKRSIDKIGAGMTERAVAALIEYNMRLLGGDGIAFETIAVAGVNSSKPHGVPGDYILKSGDFLTLDFGAKYKGYCSDMTRTLAIGDVSDEMKMVYDTVLNAQLSSLDKIKAGEMCSEIDGVARNIINKNYNGTFGHGLGHSVGIDIHESPSLSPRCNDILQENMLMTCEPGIYIEGKFGVRIEDLVIVTKEGFKNLNSFPKELITL